MLKRPILPFRKVLILAAAGLLAAVLSYLGIAMYLDVKADISDLMYVTDSTYLNGISSGINTSLGDVVRTCVYLQQNGRLLENLALCENEGSPLYDRSVASGQIQNFITLALNNHALISDVIIETPQYQYKIGSHSGENYSLLLDGEADGTIRLHYTDDRNFFYTQTPGASTALSQLVYYSFTLGAEQPAAARVFVVLNSDFLASLAEHNSDILIFNENGGCIYGDAERYNPAVLSGLADGEAEVESGIGADFMETGDTVLYRGKLDIHGWTVLYLQKTTAYAQEYRFIFLFCLLFFAAAMVTSVLLARLLSVRVLRPIRALVSSMQCYKRPPESEDGMGAEQQTEAETLSRRRGPVNLRENVFLFFTVTVLLPVICFTLLFNYTSALVMARQTERSYQTAAGNTAKTLSAFFERKEKAVARIAYDNTTIQYFIGGDTAGSMLSDIIRENIFFGIDDDAMDIYDAEGALIYSNNMVAAEALPVAGIRRAPSWDVQKDALNQTKLCLTVPIAPFNYARNLCYLRLSLKYDTLGDLLGDSMAYQISISDGLGVLLGSGRQTGLQFSDTSAVQRIQNGDTVTSAQRIGNTPWYVFLQYQEPDFGKYTLRVFTENALFFIMILLMTILISYALSYALLRPLSLTHRALMKLLPGHPDIQLGEEFYIDEIAEIGRSFNRMADRVDGLIDDLVLSNRKKLQLESEKRSAEIIALQMQINPHFLSNTIDTISNIVEEGKTKQAREMLVSLNNLFRYGISKPDYLISVREELQYAHAYADIMSVRYPSIAFSWHTEEDILCCRTIKLILQPVIENAIYHGFRSTEREGTVDIRCFPEGNCVCFMVSDNGAGMDAEQLDTLRRNLADAHLGSLIGIFNVQARIRLHFGESYGVEVNSVRNGGTQVVLRIPGLGAG